MILTARFLLIGLLCLLDKMNMVYVRSKKIKGQTYYYVVEGNLVKGKVKQRVLKYLGNVNHILEVFTEYEKAKK